MLHVPSPDLIVPRLEPLTELVKLSLRHGTTTASRYLDTYGSFDAYLFATMTRYHALAKLRELHYDATAVDDADSDAVQFLPISRANLGIHMIFDGLMIRVYKSADGQLPVPASKVKQNFFNQQTEFFVDGHGNLQQSELNLVYLWDCDLESHNLSALELVCPRSGGNKRDLVSSHWSHAFEIGLDYLLQPVANRHGDLEDIPIEVAQSTDVFGSRAE